MKNKFYLPLLLSVLLSLLPSSCDLYMDDLDVPDSYPEGQDPKKDLVTEVGENGIVCSYSYTDNTIELTEQYDKYIMASVNDSILYYREDTPDSFLPKPGNVLFSKYREQYPKGLARKVTEVKKENGMFTVHTCKAGLEETFDDLQVDATEMTPPVLEAHVSKGREEVFMRDTEVSRAGGDVKDFDGETFRRIMNSSIDFSGGVEAEWGDFTGEVSGSFKYECEIYQKVFANTSDVTNGCIKNHHINILNEVVALEGNIAFSYKGKPLKKVVDKIAAGTAESALGIAGFVVYPDLYLEVSLQATLSGSFSLTQVREIYVEVDKYTFVERSCYRTISDKYGAGWNFDSFNITGTMTFKAELELRVGITLAGGVGEFGIYAKGKAEEKFTADIVNLNDFSGLKCPDEDNPAEERKYSTRSDTGNEFTIGLLSGGFYARVGAPYAAEDLKPDKKSWYNIQWPVVTFEIGDIFECNFDLGNFEIRLNVDILKWSAKKFNLNLTYKSVSKFYPELDTKRTYLKLTNASDLDRTSNHIEGIISFKNGSSRSFHQLELLVFDSTDKFVCRAKCKDTSQIRVPTYAVYKDFAFEFDIPWTSSSQKKEKYYKIYPAYKQEGREEYYYEPDFCTVKTYQPCMTFSNTHQIGFIPPNNVAHEEYDYCYTYDVYTEATIYSSPEVKDWGVSVYLCGKQIEPSEANIENLFYKFGDYMLQPNKNGVREYLKNQGKTAIMLQLNSYDSSIYNYYAYIIPFYLKYDSKEKVMLYDDFDTVLLKDDENINEEPTVDQVLH